MLPWGMVTKSKYVKNGLEGCDLSQSLSHFPVINQHSQLTMRSLLWMQQKKTVHPEAGRQGYLEGDLSHGCNSQWRRRMMSCGPVMWLSG